MARLLCLLLLALPAAFPVMAQRQINVAQLETFIKSAIQMRQADKQVADTLKNLKLTERLDVGKIEDLQGIGAGPRTLEALRAMSAASRALPAAVPPAPATAAPTIPAPSPEEIAQILAEVRKNAIEYTGGLPNFICTQLTKRHYDVTGNGSWRLADTIVEQLSFVDKKEDYRVVMVDNLPVTNVSHRELGGVTSSGEFGTQLYQIFKPETQAEFAWERWATLRGRRTYVFSFRVLQARSEYGLEDHESGRSMIAGYHGLIYADRDTRQVMRVRMDMDGLQNFPITALSIDLNYDFTAISGQQFVLPLKAELRSRSGRVNSLNEVEFRRYQKFGADATIIFDDIGDIPPVDTQEQPAIP